jgi:hypothetical protein
MLKRILCASIFSVSIGANSANFSCPGQVSSIAISPVGGVLQVNAGTGVHYLCKFNEPMNGVHPEVCKAWYSMFLTAQASGRTITQYYDGTNGTTCATLGNWAVPNPMPYYVELNK